MESLIIAFKNGNNHAFEELIDKYSPLIERFAFQLGVPFHDIPDITQEVFIRIFRFSNRFDGQSFTSWLYKVTMNIVKDYGRKQKSLGIIQSRYKNNHDILQEQYVQVEMQILKQEDDILLHQSIQRLPDRNKIPIILFYFHDLTYEEIAKVTGSKLSTVKVRIHRGKKMLVEEWKKTNHNGGIPFGT
ncbi:RNA polymerase sigma factor [Ornithinibacillus bavariensis]|uniref:RNA polymerase sigma factor n=1 Tax=Ornithinibacillus bavariensis TaxID=545502 RepID=A0A919X8C5_9BACI|nr:sigma-70 family RNA polymerase sigma factor [Ornithinibacillus bavariensis]GIO25968.1 RNA polymerase sigma factor [Ornithinibacillus bavariensis]